MGPAAFKTMRWRSVSWWPGEFDRVRRSPTRLRGSKAYSMPALKVSVPDFAVESIENPPLRLKPTARAPPRANVSWSMS